jgi:glycosyltransferase involved in cell wall biosynthesis
MSISTILLVYLILTTIVWLFRHRDLTQAKKTAESLDSLYPTDKSEILPKVSVLVAGKNEENNIERCLRSLAKQNYPELEVIAINDRSDDKTGEIMDRIAAESDGRIRVVHVKELSEGWLGKSHAMHEGMKLASGEYLLFTDADCFFQCPDTVRIGVQFSRDRKVDLLSVLPVLETKSFWERVLQPVCSVILMMWFRPEWVNDPTRKVAYANGAFMLFHRSCYEQVKGHEGVKACINEDMEFANRVKGEGLKLYVVQNRDLYRTRMYEDLKGTIEGWSRIYYGCFGRPRRAIVAIVVLAIMSLLPYLLLLGTLGKAVLNGWEFTNGRWWDVLAWSILTIGAQMSVLIRFYCLMGARWYRAMTYPLGAFVALGILLNTLKKFGGGKIVWRGSKITHKNVRLYVGKDD